MPSSFPFSVRGMAPRTEHWQNHPPDSQAEAVAVAAGGVPPPHPPEAPPNFCAGAEPPWLFCAAGGPEGKTREGKNRKGTHLNPTPAPHPNPASPFQKK